MAGALPRFDVPAEELAPALLGAVLERTLDDGARLAGVIVETEAYVGPEDRASHAFGGRRTPRNEHMWAAPGTAYVYFTYGMHHCFNVACLRAGHPAAVLVRALEPIDGIERMRELRANNQKRPLRERDLCSGPGKLTQAMAIDRALSGVGLLGRGPLRLRAPQTARAVDPESIACSSRIGIGSVGEWTEAPLRWFVRNNLNVSAGGDRRQDGRGNSR